MKKTGEMRDEIAREQNAIKSLKTFGAYHTFFLSCEASPVSNPESKLLLFFQFSINKISFFYIPKMSFVQPKNQHMALW